ncbi:hypothetical protein HDU96_008253 [Phlyctochytrium bullatum]|nr:hypothetical protein HDU96_008253 [Phlyctochytrium bullatum]
MASSPQPSPDVADAWRNGLPSLQSPTAHTHPTPPHRTAISEPGAIVSVDFIKWAKAHGQQARWLKGTDLVVVWAAEITPESMARLNLEGVVPAEAEHFLYSLRKGRKVPYEGGPKDLEKLLRSHQASNAKVPYAVSIDHSDEEEPYQLFRIDAEKGAVKIPAPPGSDGIFPGLKGIIGFKYPQSTGLTVIAVGTRILFADRQSANDVNMVLYEVDPDTLIPRLVWHKPWEAPVEVFDRIWPFVEMNENVFVVARTYPEDDEEENEDGTKKEPNPELTLFVHRTDDAALLKTIHLHTSYGIHFVHGHLLLVSLDGESFRVRAIDTPLHPAADDLTERTFEPVRIARPAPPPNEDFYTRCFWEAVSQSFQVSEDMARLFRRGGVGVKVVDVVGGRVDETAVEVEPAFGTMECVVTVEVPGNGVRFEHDSAIASTARLEPSTTMATQPAPRRSQPTDISGQTLAPDPFAHSSASSTADLGSSVLPSTPGSVATTPSTDTVSPTSTLTFSPVHHHPPSPVAVGAMSVSRTTRSPTSPAILERLPNESFVEPAGGGCCCCGGRMGRCLWGTVTSLTFWIILGSISGILIGTYAPDFAKKAAPTSNLFLRPIQFVVLPLVFSSLVVGIAGGGHGHGHGGGTAKEDEEGDHGAEDLKAVGRLGAKALIYFEIVTTIALVIGITASNVFQPGLGLTLPASNATNTTTGPTHHVSSPSYAQWIDHLTPRTWSEMASGELLQALTASVVFGCATASAPRRIRRRMVEAMEVLMQVMFRFVGIVIWTAPLGSMFSIANAIAQNNGPTVLLMLGKLVLVLHLSLTFLVVFVFGSICLLFRIPIFPLLRALHTPLLLAYTTGTSEAALPDSLTALQQFGVSRRIASFVLPLGYTFNLDGSTLYLSLAAGFCAQVAGAKLAVWDQVWMVLALMVSSKGVAGVRGAAVMVLAATLEQFGVDPGPGVGLVLGVDWVMDMGRAWCNVLGNGVACVVMAKVEGEFGVEVSGARGVGGAGQSNTEVGELKGKKPPLEKSLESDVSMLDMVVVERSRDL